MKRKELIKLVQIARKGSEITSGITRMAYWKFDVDSESKIVDDYLSTLPDEKEHEYHLNCTYCHTPFWSKEAFPIPQICDECKSNQP